MSRLVVLLTRDDADSVYHALSLASGALAMGWEAHIFVTSSAALLLTKEVSGRAKLSMKGVARYYVERRMKKLGIKDVDKFLLDVMKAGAKFYADEAVLRLAGYTPNDLMEGVSVSGTVSFLNLAKEADVVITI